MVSTKRSDNVNNSFCELSNGGVALLEREAPKTYNDFTGKTQVQDENLEQARERMQRNLAALLNYDKVEEKAQVEVGKKVEAKENLNVVEAESVSESVVCELSDDDIRPTLTTMQFGDGDIDQMRAEMRTDEVSKDKIALSGKGKVALVLYSLAVTVIMALIILNTGVLAGLRSDMSAKSAKLNSAANQYASIQAEIEQASSTQNIVDTAVNEFGMINR